MNGLPSLRRIVTVKKTCRQKEFSGGFSDDAASGKGRSGAQNLLVRNRRVNFHGNVYAACCSEITGLKFTCGCSLPVRRPAAVRANAGERVLRSNRHLLVRGCNTYGAEPILKPRIIFVAMGDLP